MDGVVDMADVTTRRPEVEVASHRPHQMPPPHGVPPGTRCLHRIPIEPLSEKLGGLSEKNLEPASQAARHLDDPTLQHVPLRLTFFSLG